MASRSWPRGSAPASSTSRWTKSPGCWSSPDDEQALAQALNRLLGDPALRTRLGEAGRRRVAEEFSVRQMVDKTVALYRRLVPAR